MGLPGTAIAACAGLARRAQRHRLRRTKEVRSYCSTLRFPRLTAAAVQGATGVQQTAIAHEEYHNEPQDPLGCPRLDSVVALAGAAGDSRALVHY
eukprot:scaffold1800_cov387-Prasinococcus_capsulatus_cf.AAC.11